jgi:hypothetical protein
MQRPSFQFYPMDWLNDPALQACSWESQGIWINLLCRMHQGNPYGYLTFPNGKKYDDKDLMKALRLHHKTWQAAFKELSTNGVLRRDENGIFYSKRMVEDERIRLVRAESGKQGGNPNLVNQTVKQKTTPSSSSSSSILKPNGFRERSAKAPPTPKATAKNRGTRLSEDWSPPPALAEWAKKERPDLDIALESASFRDYWTAKPGQDGLKLDWDATFRNWIRRARGQNLGQTQSRASHQRLHGADIVPAEQRQGGVMQL